MDGIRQTNKTAIMANGIPIIEIIGLKSLVDSQR
jgi:hypothetical protein